jgi:hypothetical protein
MRLGLVSMPVRLSITGSSDVEAPDLVLHPDFEKSAIVHVETEEGAPL